MSNKQAQATKKLILKHIVLTFEDGSASIVDLGKVDIVDRVTRKPLFEIKK